MEDRKKEYLKELKKKYPIEKFYEKHHYYYSPITKQPVSPKQVVEDYIQITVNEYKHYLASLIAKHRKKIKKTLTLDKYLVSKNFRKVGGNWYPIPKAVELLLKRKKEDFERKRKQLITKIKHDAKSQAEREIYKKHHYVYYKNKWQPAKPLLEKLINDAITRVN